MTKTSLIEKTINMINLSETELLSELEIGDKQIERNVQYEKIKNVTRYRNPEIHPGHFYVKDKRIKMIYISDSEALSSLNIAELQEKYGVSKHELRSRVGKHAQQYVYPELGLAYAADDEVVYYLEIFPKTTIEGYLESIYEEPPIFRK